MRKIRDRDFIESKKGMLFCVVGNVHPKDRAISYLKYIPWKEENAARLGWKREEQEYYHITERHEY
ncbi:MAG: hypothetical protein NDF55_02140 [archaeon GB-1867-005]|mgnify:CR=1 FL=1|nr:hypothetical protein [Candidatus Culexmicrobium cathedralense]